MCSYRVNMTSVCSDGEYEVVNTEALLRNRQTVSVRNCEHVMFI